MYRFGSKVLVSLASVIVLVVLASAPVAAQHGDDSESSDDSTSLSTTSDKDSSGTNSDENENEIEDEPGTEVEVHHQDMQNLLGKLHVEARGNLAERRRGRHQHSVEARQKTCEEHQTAINRKVARFGTQAQKHLDVFNSVFDKVQSFQASKKLDAPDYASLVATANARKVTAATAVAVLKSLSVNIDCSASDPAASLATIKASVKDSRETLQDYRKAIVDVINSLRAVKTDDSSDMTQGAN